MVISFLVWILAAPAVASAGACANEHDEGWLASNYSSLEGTSKDCAFECLTDDAACASRCMRSRTALSAACTDCFGHFIDCTTSNCALRCIVASSDMCVACRSAHCESAFEQCAGVSIRR